MKNYSSKLKIIVVGAVLIAMAVATYFYNQKHRQIDLSTEDLAAAPEAKNETLSDVTKIAATGTPVAIKDRTLKKDGFTIMVPAGWAEVNYMAGATIVANPGEENLDPVLGKSGFKSYFSVTREKMGEKTWAQAVNYVETIVNGSAPEIKYMKQEDGKIGGIASHFWEADLARDGVKFKILVYAVRGKGDDLWILTFNTGASMWPAYSRLAPKVFESFKLL
ncbi:MAG: hypothetical protein HZA25_03420 [Candidatus Niyogibacteria bacterium]|nr:hypothetical protein [Candidatus Niyogibacteria bacterium]